MDGYPIAVAQFDYMDMLYTEGIRVKKQEQINNAWSMMRRADEKLKRLQISRTCTNSIKN